MGFGRVYILLLGVGLGVASLNGVAWAQPSGYTTSQSGATHIWSVELDGDFGPAGTDASGNQLYEFGYQSAIDPKSEWPVCGDQATTHSLRIPVSADGSYFVSSAATTTYPNAFDNLTVGPRYLSSPSAAPVYAYRRPGVGSRCACLSDMITPRTNKPTHNLDPSRVGSGDLSNTPTQRFLASTYDQIQSASSTDFTTNPYGPVAVSNSEVGDPRSFQRFHTATTVGNTFSVCSCPNINEKASPLTPLTTDNRFGSQCAPMVNDLSPGPRVLASFSGINASQILTAWKEHPTVSGVALASRINLPKSAADQTTLAPYDRRIWICSAPYELNKSTGNCEYDRQKHACGEGSTGIALSPYGENAPGSNANFQKLANKKLACCLNSHMLTAAGATDESFFKYDCTETKLNNPGGASLDFNDLWAGSDDTQDGGQLNALALVSAVGQPITGFYTLRGTRCGKFSEFGGVLQPKRVRPYFVSTQQSNVAASGGIENMGSAFPLPSSPAYQNLKAGINKVVPTTLQEMNECPILVRAALVVTCPQSASGILPNLRLQEPADSTVIRCPMAASLTVHLRIEQLFHIAGQAPLKTFDTRAMKDQLPNLDVSEIIGSRFGETCYPGTRRGGDVCAY
jgi:hypothetical protein